MAEQNTVAAALLGEILAHILHNQSVHEVELRLFARDGRGPSADLDELVIPDGVIFESYGLIFDGIATDSYSTALLCEKALKAVVFCCSSASDNDE